MLLPVAKTQEMNRGPSYRVSVIAGEVKRMVLQDGQWGSRTGLSVEWEFRGRVGVLRAIMHQTSLDETRSRFVSFRFVPRRRS